VIFKVVIASRFLFEIICDNDDEFEEEESNIEMPFPSLWIGLRFVYNVVYNAAMSRESK
jgi:hypothetical protein